MSVVAVAVSAVVAVGTAVYGGEVAKSEGKKNRQLMFDLKMAELANTEKIEFERIRTEAETQRIQIFSNSITEYRIALQKESTIRLRDSWVYIASLGSAIGVVYATSLILTKKAD